LSFVRFVYVLLFVFIFNTSVSAACLEVDNEDLDLKVERTHTGMITAVWSVKVSNQCDQPYDGTLRIQFLLEDENIPQETVDFIILQARESGETSGTINLMVDDLSQVLRTEVEITERERPL